MIFRFLSKLFKRHTKQYKPGDVLLTRIIEHGDNLILELSIKDKA